MDKKVAVYSTPTCPYCTRVKKFLEDNNIKFENIDVGSNPDKAQEMVDKLGQMGVPVIVIDDQPMVGFDEGHLKSVLGI